MTRAARPGRELVVSRRRVYELDGDDSRTLAAVGAFRVVPEHDLDIDHGTLGHLHDDDLVETVNLGDDERGLTLTREGRDLLDSHSMDRDDEFSQAFYAGVSRERELGHDSNLYATYRQEESRLDRLGRNLRHLVLLLDERQARGITFITLGESIDTGTPVSRLSAGAAGGVRLRGLG